ncbi:uncharacterized protein LOC109489645 isoform X4 [Ailuropoda melanoleuca]|uniref:uncharacterized protein LOC109489645 isoform X4 n=1 Tax=Ailuropoda melanoleuca TaxID=9646 RepID=UPI0014949F6A|nr:uncharacterized protein LOC109489645 isoform X4 [Ailuropoda melanoleuca]
MVPRTASGAYDETEAKKGGPTQPRPCSSRAPWQGFKPAKKTLWAGGSNPFSGTASVPASCHCHSGPFSLQLAQTGWCEACRRDPSLSSPCPLPGSEEPVHVLDEGAEAPVSSQGWNWLYWDIERIQFSAGLRALVSLLGSQGTRFSTLCTVRASNKRLSRSPTQRTRLGETRWEEAPGPCAQLCIDRVRPRSPPPSVHPNSADPLRQSGTQRAGTLPGPSRTSDGCPQPAEPPVLLASLQPHPCSGVLAPRSGSAGPRSQRAGSGSAPRRVRNP